MGILGVKGVKGEILATDCLPCVEGVRVSPCFTGNPPSMKKTLHNPRWVERHQKALIQPKGRSLHQNSYQGLVSEPTK